MSKDDVAYRCPDWCRASDQDAAHRWGGSAFPISRQHVRHFGHFSVVQTERLGVSGTNTALEPAEMVPDPGDRDETLDRDLREASLLWHRILGAEG